MKIQLNYVQNYTNTELIMVAAFQNSNKELLTNNWHKNLKESFNKIKSSKNFVGKKGDTFLLNLEDGSSFFIIGLGEKKKVKFETLRKEISKSFKLIKDNTAKLSIDIDSFTISSNLAKTVYTVSEAINLTNYKFNKYKSSSKKEGLKEISLDTKSKKTGSKKIIAELEKSLSVSQAVNFCRDLINEPPNMLNSVNFAKVIEKDSKNLKRVKIKVLNKAEIKKEKMNLLLAVNAGSSLEPRVVHLTYTPKKCNSKTKHIALVGKGLTFDTGGYSLKPPKSMVNMKFDMGGAATIYGAFKAAVENDANIKISCILGITDNAIGPLAVTPDSVITARNGKTIEIENTDAEGRLVLADVLDYASEQKPNVIIDSATLTGAVLVALGDQIAGVMGNDQKLVNKLLQSAKNSDEYMWQLPIIDEFRDELISKVSDLKNMGNSRYGGSSKAAAFLEKFVHEGISWAHIDIAGVGDAQKHLPYCPAKGASGLIVRTLYHYLMEQ